MFYVGVGVGYCGLWPWLWLVVGGCVLCVVVLLCVVLLSVLVVAIVAVVC